MVGAVIITFFVTALGMLVILLLTDGKKQYAENARLRKSNERLNGQLADMVRRENSQKERDAYNRGIYDGRSTDTLYRKMLAKYTAGEQATVMMYGEDSQPMERRSGI